MKKLYGFILAGMMLAAVPQKSEAVYTASFDLYGIHTVALAALALGVPARLYLQWTKPADRSSIASLTARFTQLLALSALIVCANSLYNNGSVMGVTTNINSRNLLSSDGWHRSLINNESYIFITHSLASCWKAFQGIVMSTFDHQYYTLKQAYATGNQEALLAGLNPEYPLMKQIYTTAQKCQNDNAQALTSLNLGECMKEIFSHMNKARYIHTRTWYEYVWKNVPYRYYINAVGQKIAA